MASKLRNNHFNLIMLLTIFLIFYIGIVLFYLIFCRVDGVACGDRFKYTKRVDELKMMSE